MTFLKLECNHRIGVTDEEGKKTKVGHLVYCPICQDIKKIDAKY